MPKPIAAFSIFLISFLLFLMPVQLYAQLSNNLLNALPDSCLPVLKNKKNPDQAELIKIFKYAKEHAIASIQPELDSLAANAYKNALASSNDDDECIQLFIQVTDYYTNFQKFGTGLKYCEFLLQKMEGKKKYTHQIAYYRMMKGHCYAKLGNYEESIRYDISCLDSARAINDSVGMAEIYSGLSTPYDQLGLYSLALASCDSSIAYYKNAVVHENEIEDVLSNKCWQCLHLYASTGDEVYSRMAQQIIDDSKKRNTPGALLFAIYPVDMAYIDKNYSRVLFLADSLESNIIKLYPTPFQIYTTHYIDFRKGSSLIYTGKASEGIPILKQLIRFDLSTIQEDLPAHYSGLSKIADILCQEYKKENNLQQELFYLDMYKTYSDSIAAMQNRGALFVVEQEYSHTKKETQAKSLESNNIIKHKQSTLIVSILIALGLFILAIAIVLHNRKQQLKLKKQLAENEERIKMDKLQIAGQLQIAGLEEKNRMSNQEEQKQIDTIASIGLKLQDEINNSSDNVSKNSMKEIQQLIADAYDATRNRSLEWTHAANKETNDSYSERITELLKKGLPANYEKEIKIDNEALNGTSLQVKIEMLYIIKEAIANSIKYTGAKKISIHIYENNRQIVLSIVDDGKVLNPGNDNNPELNAITTRSASIGGTAEFLFHNSGNEIKVIAPK